MDTKGVNARESDHIGGPKCENQQVDRWQICSARLFDSQAKIAPKFENQSESAS
jgi:hypothetical protein